MPVVLPKNLGSNNTSYVLQATGLHLHKYKHLIVWKNGASILEFGFASGKNSMRTLIPLLPDDYKEFIASDKSENLVEYAKKKHANVPRSKFVQMDIETKNMSKKFECRFDHIFGFFVMHFMKSPRQAFQNIHNMLKPGGSVFLNFFERIPVDDFFHNLSQHPKWSQYGHEYCMSPYYYSDNPKEEYRKDIEAAGFRNYIHNTEKGHYVYSSEKEVNDLHIAVNSILPRIPRDEVEEYTKCYLAEIDRASQFSIKYKDGQKIIALNYTMFVFIATKNS